MKKIMIALIALIPLVLIFTIQVTSTYIAATTYISVEKVIFEDDEKTIIMPDDNDVKLYYPALVMPMSATDPTLIYYSSDENIATVDKDGNITFKDFGKVVITVQSAAHPDLTDKCEFLVTDDKAHRINILNEVDSLIKGETLYLKSEIIPAEALDKNLTYVSSNEEVATVSPDGMITAVDGGTTTISVITANGKIDSFQLEVIVKVESISIVGNNKLTTGQKTAQFPNVVITPNNSTNQVVRYLSSDSSIATISASGAINFLKAGEVTFTATTVDGGFSTSYKVEYTGGLILKNGIEIIETSEQLDYKFSEMSNQLIDLEIKVSPADAVMTNVWWETSNENVVKIVDGKPVVCGGGEATIYLKANCVDGSVLTTSKKVYVERPASEIVVNNVSNDSIEINETEFKIDYSVFTADGTTDHTDIISFEVNSGIAMVNTQGLVSFDAPGEVVVSIKANSTVQKNITIKYVPAGAIVVEITQDNQDVEMNYGQSVVFVFNGIDMGTPTFTIAGKSANNVDVLTMDESTLIFTANNGGNAVVTATGNTDITINVKVIRNVNDINYVIGGVSESNGVISTALSTFELSASIYPLDSTIQEIIVGINNPSIAEYNVESGKINFLQAGSVVITLKALRNPNSTDIVEKTITATSTFGLPSTFSVDEKIIIGDVGQTAQITFGDTFLPNDYVFNKSHFTYTSDDSDIASVGNAVITGNKWGTTTIRVSVNVLNSTITKTIEVEVQEKSDSVDFMYNNKVMGGGVILGDSIQLGSRILPTETNNKTVEYSIESFVEGAVGDATINANTGLLSFTKACAVVVKVTTADNGTTKTIYIKKLTGPEELQVYYGENVASDLIKIEANGANPVLRVNPYTHADTTGNYPDGIYDMDLKEITDSYNSETGMTIASTVQDVSGYRYFTIVPTKTIVKSLSTTVTFKYGTTEKTLTIKFYSITDIKLSLDNKNDVEYGLEQRRVFGTFCHENNDFKYSMNVEFSNTPTNVEDQLYWFVKASDRTYAYFSTSTSNELMLNTTNMNNALAEMTNYEGGYPTLQVTIFVGNESDYSLYDNLLTTPSTDPTFKWDYYTFTFVNGCNIFDGDDFDFAWQRYQRMIMHTNIGTEEDKVEGQSFGVMSDTTKSAANHFVDLYGNGYTINFEGHSGNVDSAGEIYIFGDSTAKAIISNVNLKRCNMDTSKKSYTRSFTINGGLVQYSTIQCIDVVWVGPVRETTHYDSLKFYKTIFRYASECGLQIDAAGRKIYLEDCMFHDVGQCAADFQEGTLYVKGFLDIYNYVTYKVYKSTYQSTIKEVFNSSEFADYVDKSGSEAMANVGVLIVSLGSAPAVDTVYFWDEQRGEYVANTDNCTGYNYNKVSKNKTVLLVLKVYIHMWLMNVNSSTSIKPGDAPQMAKLYRKS